MEPIRRALGLFHETTGLALCVCTPDGEMVFAFPESGSTVIPPEYVGYCLEDFRLQGRDETHPLVMMMEPAFFLGVALLPGGQFLILGPAAPVPPTQQELLDFCTGAIYPDKILDFCAMLSRTPCFSHRQYASALAVAVQLCGGGAILLEDIILCNNTRHEEPRRQLEDDLFEKRENAAFHTSYSFEKEMLATVEAGDLPGLRRVLAQPVLGRAGRMAAKPLTQEKYVFVSFAALLTRAAIRGGVNQETAYTLSDVYCQQMDAMGSIPDIAQLTYKMALDFCQRVRDERQGGQYSAAVRACREYISQHLHEEISLADLARAGGLCTRSISRKFRAETGQAVPDYIHAERMREAKHLLEYSSHSISAIGSYLQYNSQSYFTRIFKSIYGLTPQQYRDKHREGSRQV